MTRNKIRNERKTGHGEITSQFHQLMARSKKFRLADSWRGRNETDVRLAVNTVAWNGRIPRTVVLWEGIQYRLIPLTSRCSAATATRIHHWDCRDHFLINITLPTTHPFSIARSPAKFLPYARIVLVPVRPAPRGNLKTGAAGCGKTARMQAETSAQRRTRPCSGARP